MWCRTARDETSATDHPRAGGESASPKRLRATCNPRGETENVACSRSTSTSTTMSVHISSNMKIASATMYVKWETKDFIREVRSIMATMPTGEDRSPESCHAWWETQRQCYVSDSATNHYLTSPKLQGTLWNMRRELNTTITKDEEEVWTSLVHQVDTMTAVSDKSFNLNEGRGVSWTRMAQSQKRRMIEVSYIYLYTALPSMLLIWESSVLRRRSRIQRFVRSI